MANEKVVGLRIELNGFRGVITNIKQFEDELRKAKEDLNELEIGSANFKTLTSEISKAEGQLMGLRKATQGINPSQQIEAYGKLAAGITSSFAAATAAVELFGADSEEVTKASVTAQNLLTVALAARSIEELQLGTSIVARTVAQKALTAAETTEIGVLKTLYTTIAANPVGAILVAVGLLITAFVTLTSETEDATKAQQDFNNEVNKDAAKTITNMNMLVNTINNQSLSLKTRKAALEDLKKVAGPYLKDLKDEEILTGKVKINTELLTDALIAQAKARALQGRIEENVTKLLDAEDKLLLATRNRIKAEKDLQDVKNAPAAIGGGTFAGTYEAMPEELAQQRLNRLKEDEGKLIKEKLRLNDLIQKDANVINDINIKTDKVLGDTTASTKELTKATDAQVQAEARLNKQLSITEQEYSKTLDYIKKLVNVTSVDVKAPPIIKELEDILSSRQALTPDNLVDIFDKIGVSIATVQGKIYGLGETVKKGNEDLGQLGKGLGDRLNIIEDTFGKFVDDVRSTLTDKAITQGVVEFGKTVDEVITQAGMKLEKGLISQEAFNAFKEITEQYKQFNKLTQLVNPEVFNVQNIKEFLAVQEKVLIYEGKINYTYDETSQLVSKVSKEGIDYTKERLTLDEKVLKYQNDLIEYYKKQYDEEEKAFKQGTKFANLTEEQQAKLKDSTIQTKEKVYETIEAIGKISAEGLRNVIDTIVKEENQVREFLAQTQELKTQARALESVAIKQALLNNLDLVYEVTQKEKAIYIDVKEAEKDQAKALSKLEEDLLLKGIDITKYTSEEKAKVFKFYLDKQMSAVKETTNGFSKETNKMLDDIQKGLQFVSKSLSDIASIAAQSFQLQLDRLQSSYQDTLSQIVGDTEEANAKRVELEKEYQAEKKAIEKEAQLTALKFTLAQSIASASQAIVGAFATYGASPAAFVIAGITAGITAAQIAIISDQISQVQNSKRRGGLLAGGGLVEGPSHEQGGVYAGGGFVLEGNEAVINRQSTLKYAGLLSQINESGGGRPITVQAPMDSRLVEALAKQNSEPIRAYVVESDISKAQAINKRLEQLASF
jgi:hypothetical protein